MKFRFEQTSGNKKNPFELLKRVFKYMNFTHINLTSQERTHENDDDVVVVLSF